VRQSDLLDSRSIRGMPLMPFVWKKNGSIVSGQTTNQLVTSLSSNGTLEVTVTDAIGATRSTTKSISVSSSAPLCPL
jgi:hypothetical protein